MSRSKVNQATNLILFQDYSEMKLREKIYFIVLSKVPVYQFNTGEESISDCYTYLIQGSQNSYKEVGREFSNDRTNAFIS